jgi:hypothetical protein
MHLAPPHFAAAMAGHFALLVVAGTAAAIVEQPAKPQYSIEQVVEFYIEEEGLAVRTALRPTNGLLTVDVSDLPGTMRVDVTLRSRRDRPGGSLFFKLMHTSPDDGDAGNAGRASTDTNLFVRPGYFQLNRVTRSGDELWTASLTQSGDFGNSAVPLADRDDRVSLRVRRIRVSTGALAEDIQRSAPSFIELLRRYPHETTEHLGPVFREFKQEANVFGADARVAWQVLSDRLPRDPKLVPKVEALVAQLDASDYRERESAARRLRELGGPAALVLSDLPRGRYSAEQNSRIDTVLADYRPLADDVAEERLNDPEFLLSCLAYSDDALIRAGAAKRLAELTGKSLAASVPADRETRLKLVRQLRKTLGSDARKAASQGNR